MTTLTVHLTLTEPAAALLLPFLREVKASLTLVGGGELTNVTPAPSVPLVNPPRPKRPALRDTAGFVRFWAAYPPRMGKRGGRLEALTKWHSKGCEEYTDRIVAAVQHSVRNDEQWRESNGKYIPMASVYLNKERWRDEVGVTVQQAWVQDDRSARALEAMR